MKSNNWLKYTLLVCVVAVGSFFGWKWWKRRKVSSTSTEDSTAQATKAIGYRINNPLNIRYSSSNNWHGQTGQQSGFCVFDTPENGLRAAMINLKSYRKKGVITIGDIISRWAPPSENNTQSYIDFVCNKLGASPSYEVAQEQGEYIALLQAMCIMEIGCQPYTDSQWQIAAKLANL